MHYSFVLLEFIKPFALPGVGFAVSANEKLLEVPQDVPDLQWRVEEVGIELSRRHPARDLKTTNTTLGL